MITVGKLIRRLVPAFGRKPELLTGAVRESMDRELRRMKATYQPTKSLEVNGCIFSINCHYCDTSMTILSYPVRKFEAFAVFQVEGFVTCHICRTNSRFTRRFRFYKNGILILNYQEGGVREVFFPWETIPGRQH